jgi:hypothetical protein
VLLHNFLSKINIIKVYISLSEIIDFFIDGAIIDVYPNYYLIDHYSSKDGQTYYYW